MIKDRIAFLDEIIERLERNVESVKFITNEFEGHQKPMQDLLHESERTLHEYRTQRLRLDSLPAVEIGLYEKFTVRRIDKQDEAGKKHHKCFLFVLDLDCDPYAIPALEAYADACAYDYPALAADLRTALND